MSPVNRRATVRLTIAFVIVASALLPRVPAEENETPRRIEQVACPVTLLRKDKEGKRVLVITRGSVDGITKGARGALRAVRPAEDPTPNADAIGTAEVVAVGAEVSLLRCTLTNEKAGVVVGDVVELDCRVPIIEGRGLLWSLMKKNILLGYSQAADRAYYTYRDIAAKGDAAYEKLKLDAMVDAIRQSGKNFGHIDALQVKLHKGRYKGRTSADLMVNATRDELITFLQFIEGYPGKYIGKRWNVDEVYATWLINHAPYSSVEIAALLEKAATAEERTALFTDYPELARFAVDLLDERATAHARADRFDEAEASLEIVREAAKHFDDERFRRDVLFKEAYILHERRKYLPTASAYSDLIVRLREADPRGETELTMESAALHNRGLAMESLGLNDAALKDYTTSIALKEQAGASVEWAAGTRRARADLLRKMANHVEAIRDYELAEVGLAESLSRKGLNDVISGRAKSLAKLGRNKEAAEAYEKLIREHRRLGDWKLEASTWNDVGSQRWSLGDYAGAEKAYGECLRIYVNRKHRADMGNVLDNMARLEENQGNYEQARKTYAAAAKFYLEFGDKENAAEVLASLAKVELATGDHAKGMALLAQALQQQEALNNLSGQLYVHTSIGHTRSSRQEYEAAMESFDRCVELAREMKVRGSLAEALRNRAGVARVLEDMARAEADLSEALAIVRQTRELGEEAEIQIALAEVAWQRRDFVVAQRKQAAALQLSREIGNRLLEAHALLLGGRLAGAQYEHDGALRNFRDALAIYEDPVVADPKRSAEARLALASWCSEGGQWEEGRKHLAGALDTARECGASNVVHEALLSLAYASIDRGAYAEAKSHIDAAEKVEGLGLWEEAARLYARSSYAQSRGEGARALEATREALAIYERLRNDWQQATAYNLLAHLLRSQGDAERAREQVKKALPIMKRIGDFGSLTAVEATAGEIETDLKNFDVALLHFGAALKAARRSGAPARIAEVLLLLGRCKREQGTDLAGANEVLTEAATAFQKLGSGYFVAVSQLELAAVAIEQKRDATTLLDDVDALVKATASPHLDWRYHDLRSRATTDLDAALAHRRKAIQVLDRLRAGVGNDERAQRMFLRSKIRVYESMADLLGQRIETETDKERRQAYMNEALAFLAKARFEILRQDVTAGGSSGSAAVDALLNRIAQAKRDIANLEKRIQEAKAQGNDALEKKLTKVLAQDLEKLAELHDNLAAADTDFASRIKFNPAYFEGWAALPKDARLVIYFPGVSKLYIWVYGSDGFVSWKQRDIGREKLHGLVREFRDGIDEVIAKAGSSKGRGFGLVAEANEKNPEWYRKNCKRMREVLTELHTHLIAPIQEETAAADPLLVLPYGLLSYLPFEALLDDQGVFLGEQRRLAYFVHKDHMSLTLNRLGRPRKEVPDYWCAFADPVGKLNTALEEVAEITPLFEKHDVHTQASGTATEMDLLNTPEECTILHFATHGYLSGDRPSDTYIELAPSPTQDGKLMQKEIWPRLRTKLPSIRKRNLRLVVLSACETARGAYAPEAEVLGLPEKFAAVGVPSVVASLWSVYTWSTTDLMVNFYAGLRQKDRGIAGALKEARLALLKDRDNGRYAHPYYWAPFLVFGDWR